MDIAIRMIVLKTIKRFYSLSNPMAYLWSPILRIITKKTVCICPAKTTVEKTLQKYIDDIIIQYGPHPYSYLSNRLPILLNN